MVKNTKGGNKNKKLARKNMDEENIRKKARLADTKEPCEMYANVTKMFGQGNCEVLCNDGIKRICVIRKKFKGRNKRSNMIFPDCKVLIGVRDWEITKQDKKQKCDLLEVYQRYQIDEIKDDPNCNWDMIKDIHNIENTDTYDNAGFEFSYAKPSKKDVNDDFDDIVGVVDADDDADDDNSHNNHKVDLSKKVVYDNFEFNIDDI